MLTAWRMRMLYEIHTQCGVKGSEAVHVVRTKHEKPNFNLRKLSSNGNRPQRMQIGFTALETGSRDPKAFSALSVSGLSFTIGCFLVLRVHEFSQTQPVIHIILFEGG